MILPLFSVAARLPVAIRVYFAYGGMLAWLKLSTELLEEAETDV